MVALLESGEVDGSMVGVVEETVFEVERAEVVAEILIREFETLRNDICVGFAMAE